MRPVAISQKIIFFGFGVDRVAWKAYVLGCIVAETTSSEVDEVVDILHVIILEIRILGIYIRKSAHFICSALFAVVVVDAIFHAVGME